MSMRRRRRAGPWILAPVLFLIAGGALEAQKITLYTGFTSSEARYLGVSLGGDIFPYLQLQVDIFKFTKKDSSLYSEDPEKDRSDFLGASLNFALKLPISLIAPLYKLKFVDPYLLAGYGAGPENLRVAYFDVPNAEGKGGFFTKLRRYHSYGAGVIVWLVRGFGVEFDYRSISMPGLVKMNYPSRKFSRMSFGICLGSGE